MDTSHPVLFEMPIKLKNSHRDVMHLSIFIPVLKNLLKSEFVFFEICVFTNVTRNYSKKKCASSSPTSFVIIFKLMLFSNASQFIYELQITIPAFFYTNKVNFLQHFLHLFLLIVFYLHFFPFSNSSLFVSSLGAFFYNNQYHEFGH